jgi:hypothetical protein
MTNDPQRGRPDDPMQGRDPNQGGQDPNQGGQDPMQGRQDPMQGRDPNQGRQDPMQGRDPNQGRQDPMQGRDPNQGRQQPPQGRYEQQGSYQTTEHGAREVRAEPDRPRGSNRARLGVLSGLLGLIALGGVTAGLVASNAATTPTPHVTPTHVPTSHTPTTSPKASASPTTSAKRLISATGSASGTSASFVVPSSTVSAHYTYTCPSSLASAPHGFSAQLENAAKTDILPIAASRNMSGSGTVRLHPKDVGSSYHIVTTTNCPYTVRVDSP